MPRPNLVLVTLDDLSEIDLTPARAPNWHLLAQHGRRFLRPYSMPVCSQSRACLAWGRYGRSLGIVRAMSAAEGPEPGLGVRTIASALRESGYATALAGKWHLGRNPLAPGDGVSGAPLLRGLNHWLAGSPDNLENYSNWERWDETPLESIAQQETLYAPTAQLEAALDWWKAAPHPRFLWFALNLPHGPFHEPPPAWTEGYTPDPTQILRRQRYELMIRAADYVLGQLRSFPGMETSTVLCVTSDNGTPANAAGPGQDPARLKTTTFDGGVRVPMLWYGPPSHVVYGVDPWLTHLVDVPVTMLELGQVPPELWPMSLDGFSLGSRLIGGPSFTRRVVAEAEVGDGTLEQAVIGDVPLGNGHVWKVKRTLPSPGAVTMYDLDADPLELTPVYDAAAYDELAPTLLAYPPTEA